MLPGRHLLPHRRRPLGGQAGEQERPLDLGARNRKPVVDAHQSPAPHHQGRQPSAGAPVDAGAHRSQRLDHPVHGPASDGIVAGQDGQAVDGRGPAGEQPDPGSGVADVDGGRRLAQPVGSAVHDHLAAGPGGHPGSEAADRGQGVPDVGAGGQAAETGSAFRPGRQ